MVKAAVQAGVQANCLATHSVMEGETPLGQLGKEATKDRELPIEAF